MKNTKTSCFLTWFLNNNVRYRDSRIQYVSPSWAIKKLHLLLFSNNTATCIAAPIFHQSMLLSVSKTMPCCCIIELHTSYAAITSICGNLHERRPFLYRTREDGRAADRDKSNASFAQDNCQEICLMRV